MIYQPNKILILDLDETLVYATKTKLNELEDFVFDDYWVYKRPSLDLFLKQVSKHFKVGIWSSADDIYVEQIVKLLKLEFIELEMVWGRSKCSRKHDLDFDTYFYEKRLDKLKSKGFKLEEMIIVDDTPQKARSNYGNLVLIKEFIGDQTDCELNYLSEYLIELKNEDNIRAVEKRNWRQKFGGL